MKLAHACLPLLAIIVLPAAAAPPAGAGASASEARHARIVSHWSGDRRAAAIPRDLVIDTRGLGYLRRPDGALQPYGHDIAAMASNRPSPNAKPVPGDTEPPSISGMDPAAGATIGGSYTFSAVITDTSGVKSATFTVQKAGSQSQSFAASPGANDRWSVSLTGLTDGNWSWRVSAKDNGGKGGNTAISDTVNFAVSTGGGGGGGGGGGTVTNAEWTAGGDVQTAAGRIYFEMPSNARRTRWNGYVCSGTAVTDSTTGRSVILTAAHCVYDDANKAFARNVLFIPNQADTTGAGTDLNCSNDPLGCWTPSFGVVDTDWSNRTFPDNIAWDYAWYVVNDTGAHTGTAASSNALDAAAGTLTMDFTAPSVNDGAPGEGSPDFTHALGYSYSDDPNFMYCAEDMTTEGSVNWWLPSCELSGGSSGGPWAQPMDESQGDGPVISVNSWGYTNSPGMAGPKLSGSSAQCVFEVATSTPLTGVVPTTDGNEGVATDCP
ncbi:MAG: hypothetical protein WD793_12035 [Steroidobacteraceae bacterium]